MENKDLKLENNVGNKVKKSVKFCQNNTELINPETLFFSHFLKRILGTKGGWISSINNFDYP